ncbi:KinB-signaling pathway activation protein, partial [Siminovitchia fortis]|uniref:KinB-signaling pathway activation protein n=1 Tax=Siminovitchia fortis TaxID=254758 RepID=UPI0016433F3C
HFPLALFPSLSLSNPLHIFITILLLFHFLYLPFQNFPPQPHTILPYIPLPIFIFIPPLITPFFKANTTSTTT